MQPKRVGTNGRPMRGTAFIHAVFIQGRRLFGGGVYCNVTTTVNLLSHRKSLQKKEKNRSSCTGKILGCYHGIGHRRNFRERAKQQSYEV